jgi:hypothetical protein
MDNYYKNLEIFLKTGESIMVYPTLGGILDFIQKDQYTLIMEKDDTLRTGWNNLTGEILTENDLKKYQSKLTPPRKCSPQDLIKALKKLDTLTPWGQLIISINNQIHIIASYMKTLAYNQSTEWINHIFTLSPNISLDELHNLIENNNTDLDSQIALTRTWLQLIRNVQDNENNENIVKDIQNQIRKAN